MTQPHPWPVPSPSGGREAEIQSISAASAEGHCVSVVGMSNVGKSYVLRALCTGAGPRNGTPATFVYIDCNRMVEFTDQGFYELVLRCLRVTLAPATNSSDLGGQLDRCYENVVNPSNPFLAPLRFNEAIAAACEGSKNRLVLVLDEFDEVIRDLDERVLLNLRALRDTYPERLSYICASGRRPEALSRAHGSSEFAELFAASTQFLGPLSAEAAAALVGQWVREDHLALSPDDMPLVLEESGGHPGLLAAVCGALSTAHQEAAAIPRRLTEARTRERLDSDSACHGECAKLWQELDQEGRQALLLERPGPAIDPAIWQSLAERRLLRDEGRGIVPFGRLFGRYVQRQRIVRQPDQRGVRVDVESGEVWVDGRQIPTLTDLEYRLLLLLYGHLDKITDKYSVVQAVWGQDYIDEVDDARIEKLVSRLRQKIEQDPAEPRHLFTVRGRGYRLVSRTGTA
jgi:hypothetical protein